jgi:hypothetical protein
MRMSEITPGDTWRGVSQLTDEEKLAALGTYVKVLTGVEKTLRAAVTKDMGERHVEKVGAYLPDGTKMASVSRSEGKKTAKVTNPAHALLWCLKHYPDEIVQAIRPSFLKKLTDYAQANCAIGEKGVDPYTGEELAFIVVEQGNPYVTITTTSDGVAIMTALAQGFAGMLEEPKPDPDQGALYDPAFADRLENGAYQ